MPPHLLLLFSTFAFRAAFNVVQPPGIEPGSLLSIGCCLPGRSWWTMSRTVDIKILFEQYDMVPGDGGKRLPTHCTQAEHAAHSGGAVTQASSRKSGFKQ